MNQLGITMFVGLVSSLLWQSISIHAFSIVRQHHRGYSSSILWMNHKPKPAKKLTYAERLNRQRENQSLPTSNNVQTSQDDEASEEMSRAKRMIATQKASLAMLALVQQRVEGLSASSLTEALQATGIYVVDNFLQNETILDILQQEAFDNININETEDGFAVTGGEEQYPKCPRTIELVVALTKHFSKLLVQGNFNISPRNCMATLKKTKCTSSNKIPDTCKVTILYYPMAADDGTTVLRDRLVVFRVEKYDEVQLDGVSLLELHLMAKRPLEP